MPLLDHFNPPLSRTHPWRGFHGAWAAAMARLLNQGVLPPGYYAVPLVGVDGPAEIDVATLHEGGTSADEDSPTGPEPWQPPDPGLTLTVQMPAVDAIEVQIVSDEGDPHLTACVELVSPRNKDRAGARQAFAVKCVGYLQQGKGLVVVDTVTTRRTDVQGAILSLLDGDANGRGLPNGMSAVAYRAIESEPDAQHLQLWPAALTLGQPLPTLPLWIGPDLAVPLDLEASYRTTCADLRIRDAG